ncbi:MAG TPA: MauE/DoxX family redox-associated membrane protein [Acidimicrobiales bacterium]|nr:MauE/DoxX family redox-associated membrane protein [Acidimicrobiales bacterium]
MTAWAGLYLAGCILLVVAGWAKVREPAATERALAGASAGSMSAPFWAVRAGGLVEVALGMTGLSAAAPRPAALVALCYTAFAGFVVVALARGSAGRGCGCFGAGADDVPLGPLHVVVNLALASAAAAVAAGGGLAAPAMERAGVSVLAAVLAWVVFQVFVPLPRLMAVVREARR